MEEKRKSKRELIKEAQALADKLEEKKAVIQTALDDLDKKANEQGVTQEHISGIAVVESLFTEFDELELEQQKIFEQIRQS